MQITHEEAVRLIQFNADQTLLMEKKKILNEHLRACSECRAYAKRFTEMEYAIKGVMRKQWNVRPAPLSIDILTGENYGRKSSSASLITRTAMISIAFLTFIFVGWQFTSTNNPTTGKLPVMPVIPTPSTFYTVTKYSLQDCAKISYQVQKSDTLESIAEHFSIPKEVVREVNHINTETIELNTILLIPVCESTPTSTIQPPTFTITPFLEPFTTTPG